VDASGKYLLDIRGFILRKLNVELVDVKVSIRILIVAKVIEETWQIIYSVLPHNKVRAPTNLQVKANKFFSMGFPLLL
jgi:hypothetical protein